MGLFDFVTGLVDGDDGTTDGSGRVETSTEDRDEEGGGAGTEAGATGDGSDSADDETSDAAAVPIPTVLLDCLVGGGGFAAVHDATLDDLGRSGPRLTASEHPVESD